MGNCLSSSPLKNPGGRRECHIYSNNDQAIQFLLKFIKDASIPKTASWSVDEITVALVLSDLEQDIYCAQKTYSGTLSELQFSSENNERNLTRTSACSENVELSSNIDSDRTPLLGHDEGASTENKKKNIAKEITSIDDENSLDSTAKDNRVETRAKNKEIDISQKIDATENIIDPFNGEKQEENLTDTLLVIKDGTPAPTDLKTKSHAAKGIQFLYRWDVFYKKLEESNTPKILLNYFADSGILFELKSSEGNAERKPPKSSECSEKAELLANIGSDHTPLLENDEGSRTENKIKNIAEENSPINEENPLDSATRVWKDETIAGKEDLELIDIVESTQKPYTTKKHSDNEMLLIIKEKNYKSILIDLKTKFHDEEITEISYEGYNFYKKLKENDTLKRCLLSGTTWESHKCPNNEKEKEKQLLLNIPLCYKPDTAFCSVGEIIAVFVQSHLERERNASSENSTDACKRHPSKPSECSENVELPTKIDSDRYPLLAHDKGGRLEIKRKRLAKENTPIEDDNSPDSKIGDKIVKTNVGNEKAIDILQEEDLAENKEDFFHGEKQKKSLNFNELLYEGDDFQTDLEENNRPKDTLQRYVLTDNTHPHVFRPRIQSCKDTNLNEDSGTSELQSSGENNKGKTSNTSNSGENVELSSNVDSDRTPLLGYDEGASTENKKKNIAKKNTPIEDENSPDSAAKDNMVEAKVRKKVDIYQKINAAENIIDPFCGEKQKENSKKRLLVIIRQKDDKPIPLDLKRKFNVVEVIKFLYEGDHFLTELEENEEAKNTLKRYVLSDTSLNNSRKSKTEGNVVDSCFPISCSLLRQTKEIDVLFEDNICKPAFITFMKHYFHRWNARWIKIKPGEKTLPCKPALLLCFIFSRREDDVGAAVQICSNFDAPVMLVTIHPCADEQEVKSVKSSSLGKPIVRCTDILYNRDSSQCFKCYNNKKAKKEILMFFSQYG